MTGPRSYPENPELRQDAATERLFLEDNIATVAFHLGRRGASLMVLHQGSPGLAVDPGEVLAEISRRLTLVPAQGKSDRDKLAAMLKANGFTSRDGTYLQGGTYGVIDAVLSALSSTDREARK